MLAPDAPRGRRPDHRGVNENHRSRRELAKGAAALLAVVILLNVVPRLVTLPALDVPALGLPDVPEVPGWVRKLVKLKNWALIGIAILVLIGFVADEIEKRRRGAGDTEG
jgi:hypothetical protein